MYSTLEKCRCVPDIGFPGHQQEAKATGGTGRQREASEEQALAGGKSNGRQREAKGSLWGTGTSRRQKQREAPGGKGKPFGNKLQFLNARLGPHRASSVWKKKYK